MLKKYACLFALALAFGCGGDDGGSKPSGNGAHPDASTRRDASTTTTSHHDAAVDDTSDDNSDDSQTTDPNDPNGMMPTGGGDPSEGTDASTPITVGGDADAGIPEGTGSCCDAHDTPGCGNADLMVCVCELDSTCCTVAWGKQCAFIVEQKYCQPNVRDCVCGSGMGQWGQSACCDSDWSSTCDIVATGKCNAVQGCF